jgi:hypothetical protein
MMRYVMVAVFMAVAAVAAENEPPELARLRTQYEAQVEAVVAPIRGSYAKRLEALKKTLGGAGDADGMVAVQNEIDAINGAPAAEKEPAAGAGDAVTIPVTSDQNIVAKAYAHALREDYYYLETDQTQGIVELKFSDKRLASTRGLKGITLRLHVPPVGNASSNDFIDVFCFNEKIGRFKGGVAGTWVEVPLDLAKCPKRSATWTIELRPTGGDGFCVSSKKSGDGAELKLTY